MDILEIKISNILKGGFVVDERSLIYLHVKCTYLYSSLNTSLSLHSISALSGVTSMRTACSRRMEMMISDLSQNPR